VKQYVVVTRDSPRARVYLDVPPSDHTEVNSTIGFVPITTFPVDAGPLESDVREFAGRAHRRLVLEEADVLHAVLSLMPERRPGAVFVMIFPSAHAPLIFRTASFTASPFSHVRPPSYCRTTCFLLRERRGRPPAGVLETDGPWAIASGGGQSQIEISSLTQ